MPKRPNARPCVCKEYAKFQYRSKTVHLSNILHCVECIQAFLSYNVNNVISANISYFEKVDNSMPRYFYLE